MSNQKTLEELKASVYYSKTLKPLTNEQMLQALRQLVLIQCDQIHELQIQVKDLQKGPMIYG